MELSVLVGDDDQAIRSRRDALITATGVQALHVDVTDGADALLTAVVSPSLFGGRRVVTADAVDLLTDAAVAQLRQYAAHSDAVVVARADTLPPRLRAALSTFGTVITCAVPKGRGVAIRVTQMIDESGIRLPARARQLVIERAGHDLDRVASLLRGLDLAELREPSFRQVEVLLGSSAAPGVPWTLADAVEAGNVSAAMAAITDVEPPAAAAFLAGRVMQVARLVQGAITDAAAAQKLLGLQHRFQAEKLLKVASRLDEADTGQLWDLAGRLSRAARQSQRPAAFDVTVMRLTLLHRDAARRKPRLRHGPDRFGRI